MKKACIKTIAFLGICLLLLSLPAEAFASAAADGTLALGDGGVLSWTLEDGRMTVSGEGAIPDYDKDAEKPWQRYSSTIRTLVIGDGITRIGDRAFQSCKNIETLTVGKDVASIGEWAFQNCVALSSCAMPDREVEIGKGAFRNTGAEADVLAAENSAYQDSPYCRRLQELSLSGNFRADVLTVARSQIGYHEGDSTADYDGNNAWGSQNYSEYGRYLGSGAASWCSEFASWCQRMAGVPLSIAANSRSACAEGFTSGTSSRYYSWAETIYGGGTYQPQKGDIILIGRADEANPPDEALSHTAILNEAFEADGLIVFNSISGNSSDSVEECDYLVEPYSGSIINRDNRVVAYIVSPDYEAQVKTYRVCLDANGGTAAISQKTVAEGGVYGVLPRPVREGYRFDGWYTEPVGGTLVSMGTPWRQTADQTLYAHWL